MGMRAKESGQLLKVEKGKGMGFLESPEGVQPCESCSPEKPALKF